jgi:glycerol-3-phosphate acyltransferase PlsX
LNPKLTIALDAMGGDHAPEVVVEGAAMARLRFPAVHFLMFGDEARVGPLLDGHPKLAGNCTIRHTDLAVSAEAKPSVALRQGRNTSMQLSIDAVNGGEAAGVVSAGNTGALMAMAKVTLKTLPGIDRPAIAAYCPTKVGDSVMLDLGANVECDANNLFQFGMMGAAFASTVLGLQRPTVGLLNVGAEEMKGREAVKQAASLLRGADLPFTFTGFVEGDDIGAGTVDVFVVDGFTGNIVIKAIEGSVGLYTTYLRRAFSSSIPARLGALFLLPAFKRVRTRMDPRRYNGATFLGLNGIVVKSHGGTDGFGFANAISVAVDMAANGFNDLIMRELSGFGTDQPVPAKQRAAVS